MTIVCLTAKPSLSPALNLFNRKRLVVDKEMHKNYAEVIEGYISSGYAELVSTTEGTPGNSWYLPHHPVVHPHKEELFMTMRPNQIGGHSTISC